MKVKQWLYTLFIFLLFCGLTACSSSSDSDSTSGGDGTLNLNLIDATTDAYQAVYVTISTVKVHVASSTDDGEDDSDSAWQVVATPNKTYNLLELVNGAMAQLGTTDLPAGHYTQMRLILGSTADSGLNILSESHDFPNYVIDADGNTHELKVPSGYQSGIKLVHGFDIESGQETELVLDFNADKSVVRAGNSGKWQLKPTIKILNQATSTSVSGTVTDDADPAQGLVGVLISVQTCSATAEDAKDEVTIHTSTVSDDQGGYTLTLDPGTYFIVATKEGYAVACTEITVASGNETIDAIALSEQTLTGTLSGTVTIVEDDNERVIALSVRQTSVCSEPNADERVEVTSVNVLNGETYSMTLAAGTYRLVASTDGYDTVVIDNLAITEAQTVSQDVSFNP